MLTYSLPLKWKTIQMHTSSGVFGAQAVVVGGKVYIGGGWAEANNILEYTIERGRWTLHHHYLVMHSDPPSQ